jgi:hypothetical protein
MSVRFIGPSLQQSPSSLDYRGIEVAIRLLVAGLWIERKYGHAPRILSTLAAESRVSLLTPHRFLGGER